MRRCSVDELTVVTAASSNHARCCENLLYSLRVHEPRVRLRVYDLGLTEVEQRRLGVTHTFDWSKYPAHFGLRTYAWKPVILADVMKETDGPVLWLDAGDLVRAPLGRIRRVLRMEGFYSPTSSGTIGDWTHPAVLAHLLVTAAELNEPNRNAAIVGFTPMSRALLDAWATWARDPAAIAPEGATTKNHRFDQALLSILAVRSKWLSLVDEKLDVTTHHDRLTLAEAETLCSNT